MSKSGESNLLWPCKLREGSSEERTVHVMLSTRKLNGANGLWQGVLRRMLEEARVDVHVVWQDDLRVEEGR